MICEVASSLKLTRSVLFHLMIVPCDLTNCVMYVDVRIS